MNNTACYEQIETLLQSNEKFYINLGLDRISAILNIFGNPQEKIKVIHVAGTNGKGSVSTMTAQILKEQGYKTALYTSPHLYKYNERFKINNIDISDEDLFNYIFETDTVAKKNNIHLTEFEILTAAAYKYFFDKNVDFAVMETGLGGRFDAVNAVKNPLLSTITSISIDHKDRLGDTIEKIAFEKAGIIKNNIPVVINKDNSGLNVIQQIAGKQNSKIYLTDTKIDIIFENGINYACFDNRKYDFALWGLHQKQNLSLVLKIINVLKDKGINIQENAVQKALKKVFIPARFEYQKKYNRIIDGSHNFDAALNLKNNLDFYFPNQKKEWIYGTISTKEYDKIVNLLFQTEDVVNITSFNHPLCVSPQNVIKKIENKHIKVYSKTENTLRFFSNDRLMIITGSFYMIGNFHQLAV